MNINNKNNGMLLESLIDLSIEKYAQFDLALISKNYVPIKFKHSQQKNLYQGQIISKAIVDYSGIYNGKFIAFDAKSTVLNEFYTKNIKKHQHEYLLRANALKGICFYIIAFLNQQKFFIVNVKNISLSKSKYSIEEIKKIGKTISLVLPGYLDFLSKIDK
ncbi:Holliday junction resolvase RecU [Mycoplasma phocimorsus]|uniref:Holliday junction resolvase RecU n=1 Tax=Mycoplasma phocimorsus TaxID=3045839 RepID=A0AAJ1UX03_9MOLU|nr:Holliday junction resolvase RecU [Mycoplasma phocimorsus]MDJ1646005.1 Holliday junction resolvase RecU [Mycoplasma phocimorsus]MDJ1646285.1 Holliday junction resolvase RecU [Mycoplasma phocimorsus]MDJ1647856.1 Holliday junction resolvase RecU [Mycoplasma phocimorsus]